MLFAFYASKEDASLSSNSICDKLPYGVIPHRRQYQEQAASGRGSQSVGPRSQSQPIRRFDAIRFSTIGTVQPRDPDAAARRRQIRLTATDKDDLSSGRARSLEDIGKVENVSDRYVGALMPLASLAPDIVARILAGTQPVELTASSLMTRVDFPLDWRDEKELHGMK